MAEQQLSFFFFSVFLFLTREKGGNKKGKEKNPFQPLTKRTRRPKNPKSDAWNSECAVV